MAMTAGAATGAVEATVVGAGSAGAADLLTQSFASTEDAHGRVVAADSSLDRVILNGQAVDLHAPQSLGVLGLERPGQLSHALAHRILRLDLRLHLLLELDRKCCELAVTGRAPAMMIDDRVAED